MIRGEPRHACFLHLALTLPGPFSRGLHAEGEGDFARDEAPAHFSGRAEAALPSLGLLRGSLARRRADLEGLLAGPAD